MQVGIFLPIACYTTGTDTPHSLLFPIGQHRNAYIKASKGKRTKRAAKRRRGQEGDETPSERPMPPPPEVAGCADVGLSNITRNLQLNASPYPLGTDSEENRDTTAAKPQVSYSVIFVSRSGPPSALFSHLPQMIAMASKSQQLAEPIRLVGFSKACEERLSACIGIPRVTSVGLRAGEMTQLQAVVDFVRERVPPLDVPWLEQAAKGSYHETKINTIQAPVGKKRQKKG